MRPKEKAIELFQKFDSVLIALFVCNEVLESLDSDRIEYGSRYCYEESTYWRAVKLELELM
jgi:hypothetical protein